MLVYCDLIAFSISKILPEIKLNEDFLLDKVGVPKLDLSEDGVFVSTKKEIIARDINGTKYKISVEEICDE